MKRSRREHPEFYFRGQHLATLTNEMLLRIGKFLYDAPVGQAAQLEVSRRKTAKERAVGKGYVPFSGGSFGRQFANAAPTEHAKRGEHKPSNVRDERKDKKQAKKRGEE
jgi:hypothetical protein